MRLYFRFVAAGIRARMQYKWDFLVTTVLYAILAAVDFLTVAAILYRYQYIAGWNVYEVALLAGMVGSAIGLFRCFADELFGFERYLLTGEFDNLLIRPWPTLATLLARNFDLGRIGAYLQGVVVTAFGLGGVKAPAWLAVYAYLAPVAGAVIFLAINLAVAAAGFWIVRIGDLLTFAYNAPATAASYPMDVFPRWLRWLLTSLLPVAAMSYLPMRFALGKGGTVLALLAPFAAAALALLIGYRLWRWGERHYQSTGS